MSEIANLGSLVVILLINLLVGFSFDKLRNDSPGELNRLLVAHILWAVNWFLWLLSWLVIDRSEQTAIVLNDLGAFSLIALAIALLVGTDGVRKYAAPLGSLFALDVVFLFAVNRFVHYDHTVNEKVIPNGTEFTKWAAAIPNIVQHHTMLFGPSLCVTMLSLGLVAWALACRAKHFELGILVGFVGILYALSQIYIYQSGLFVPFLEMSDTAKLLLVAWRILFVAVYWVVILTAAGICVRSRVWGFVSAAGTVFALLASIVGLWNGLRK